MNKIDERIDGVVIGLLLGFDHGRPLVVFPGNPEETALQARSLAELSSDMIGSEVALLFENANPLKPLIVGRIVDPVKRQTDSPRADGNVVRDGETVKILCERPAGAKMRQVGHHHGKGRAPHHSGYAPR